jgi:uncharacterized alpha-E superfamily protein
MTASNENGPPSQRQSQEQAQRQSRGSGTQSQSQSQSQGRRATIPEIVRPNRAMLSRTADNLFWLARYVERADYLARTIEATQRLSALPPAYGGSTNEWEGLLITAGCDESFFEAYPTATAQDVIDFLAFSPDNPASIRNCFEIARTNARSVRTALTSEMWDAINGAWLELNRSRGRQLRGEELSRFLGWVKEASLRFDGSAYRTMLRNDFYWFLRLGVFVERADNTARILDVKYHLLLPETERVGGGLDYYQWTAILRAVSAVTSYHWVYRESLKPWLIADLMILNDQMPRSLAACYAAIVGDLDEIARTYGLHGPAQRLARSIRSNLENTTVEGIFASGLHEFVTDFIEENTKLGSAITRQYLI